MTGSVGGRPEIEDHHVVLGMVDDLAERQFELDAPAPAEAALEHRQLHPLAIPIHQPEHTAPAARIADVVGDDVEVLVGAAGARCRPRISTRTGTVLAVHQRGSIAGNSAISSIRCRPNRRA